MGGGGEGGSLFDGLTVSSLCLGASENDVGSVSSGWKETWRGREKVVYMYIQFSSGKVCGGGGCGCWCVIGYKCT